jgi:hypothetical protein
LLAAFFAPTVAHADDPPRSSARIEQPDLIVKASDISFRPAKPRPGDNVDFEVIVLNLGRTATRAVIRCELIAADRRDQRVAANREFRAGIRVNRSHVVRWRVRLPQGRRVQLSVVARVEAGAPDANESNNSALVTVAGVSDDTPARASVTVTPPPFPDLTISDADITLQPRSPAAGQEVLVQAMVTNIGTVEATGGRVVFQLSVDGRPTDRHIVTSYLLVRIPTVFRYRFTMPRGREVLIRVTAAAENDSNTRNGQAEKRIRN